MRRLFVAFLTLLCAVAVSPAMQNPDSPDTSRAGAKAKPAVKRGAVFRSTREQIKQAQVILKARGFYAGAEDSKLSGDMRTALKKYQEAEGLKVTGTLNKSTLERMGVVLTDRQKEWKPAT
jgi:peptidoglycan hydrolase-like protein with peptidoglycan-binding domain